MDYSWLTKTGPGENSKTAGFSGTGMEEFMEATSMATRPLTIRPVNGKIYRTEGDESLLVLGVRSNTIFVEFADGRFRNISYHEWERLNPNPSRC